MEDQGQRYTRDAVDHSTSRGDRLASVDLHHYFRKPAFQLRFALGHTIAGPAETYAYLGLYWTWGGKEAKEGAAADTAGPAWSFAARSSAVMGRP